jgi:hypothetical protein
MWFQKKQHSALASQCKVDLINHFTLLILAVRFECKSSLLLGRCFNTWAKLSVLLFQALCSLQHNVPINEMLMCFLFVSISHYTISLQDKRWYLIHYSVFDPESYIIIFSISIMKYQRQTSFRKKMAYLPHCFGDWKSETEQSHWCGIWCETSYIIMGPCVEARDPIAK